MRIKLIACKSLNRELSYVSAKSDNIIDITWMRQGYHITPEKLHAVLQAEIDSIESGTDAHTNDSSEQDFDAIVLGYGLCSNASAGLTARSHRLVIPRAHDCITLLLGSKERYMDLFHRYPGCYWYTASWIECDMVETVEKQAKMNEFYRNRGYSAKRLDRVLEQLNAWIKEYHHAAYIRMPSYDKESYQSIPQEAAKHFQWEYHCLDGSMSLLEKIVSGEWDEESFLILEPGETATASGDDNVIRRK